MKLSCMKERLVKGLSTVSRATSSRSTLPILGNVLLATDDGKLRLSATDLEIRIECTIGATVEDNGAITVPAKTFTDLMKAFPSNTMVDIVLDTEKQSLNLRAGRNKANVKGMDAEDFPQLALLGDEHTIPVDAQDLSMAINQVAFAAAKDDYRPILSGVLVEFHKDVIKLAAADGSRMSCASLSLESTLTEFTESPLGIIMPKRSLVELSRVISNSTDPVSITMNKKKNCVMFAVSDVTIMSQLIYGNFPGYAQIVPKECTTMMTVNTNKLLAACKTVLIFARESAHIASLKASDGKIVVSAISAETGNGVSELEAEVNGDDIEIAFNVQFLVDVLSVVNTEQVMIETTTSSSPGLIKPVNGTDLRHVIMPMHLGK